MTEPLGQSDLMQYGLPAGESLVHRGVTYTPTTRTLPAGARLETCLDCGGSGQLYTRTCKSCGGRGLTGIASHRK